jgi:Nucleolar protein 12 (25kDa)
MMTATAKGTSAGGKATRSGRGGKKKSQPAAGKGVKRGGKSSSSPAYIEFNPEDRATYLKGFSARKLQRRAYGLAMQKVKDRKARLEHRAEIRLALKEQVEQAEAQKAQHLVAIAQTTNDVDSDSSSSDDDEEESRNGEQGLKRLRVINGEGATVTTSYSDVQTQTMWGGQVVVTTSTILPTDEDAQEEAALRQYKQEKNRSIANVKNKVDVEQQYAGKVEKYLHQLKGNMPTKYSKRQAKGNLKTKGKHGAAGMKGVGTGADFKLAQKMLRTVSKNKGSAGAAHGKKRKR